jgi:uncharacterized protein (TIGR04255 family)
MSKHEIQPKTFPSYQNPPVIEVVCGIRFERIEQFKAPHVGLFWQEVRNDYPICQHAPPLGFPPEPSTSDIDLGFPFPLPRVWFVNEQKSGLIQIQQDRFLFNWRKMHEKESYRRYKNVIDAFKVNFEVFGKFLEKEGLGPPKPIECELTYINHILKGEGWESIPEIREVIPDLNWRSANKRFLPEPRHLGWRVSFALPEDKGLLHVKLDHGLRKIDNRPVFILDLTARGLGADKSLDTVWNWFELAHEWIVWGFTDLTSPETQKAIWQREEDYRQE